MDAPQPPDLTLPPRRRRAWLIGIVLVGFALRLAWALFAAPDPIADFRGYLEAARAVADAGPLAYLTRSTAFRLPVYPLVLGIAAGLSSNETWLRLCNVALSAALLPMVALLGRRLGLSDRAALVAAGMIAVSPTFILFAPLMAAEHVMLLLLCGALAAALAPFGAGTFRRVVVVGLLMALTTLTRVEALFIWPAIAAGYWLTMRRRTRLPAAARIGRLLAALGIASLLLVGWTVRNHIVVGPGSGLTTSLGVQLYQAHNPDSYGFRPVSETPLRDLDELARHRRGLELAGEHVRTHPAALVLSVGRGTRDLYGVASTRTVFAHPASVEGRMPVGILAAVTGAAAWGWRLLLLLGCAAFLFRRRLARTGVAVGALLLLGSWVGHTLVLYGEPRYRLPVVVIAAVLAGVTVDGLLARRLGEGAADAVLDRWVVPHDEVVLVRPVTESSDAERHDDHSETGDSAEAGAVAPTDQPAPWWGPIPRPQWGAPDPQPRPELEPAFEPDPEPAPEPAPEPEPEIVYIQRRAAPHRPPPPRDDVEVIIPRHRTHADGDLARPLRSNDEGAALRREPDDHGLTNASSALPPPPETSV